MIRSTGLVMMGKFRFMLGHFLLQAAPAGG